MSRILGSVGWSRGLTKKTDERLRKLGKSISASLTGKRFTDKHRENLSLSHKKQIPWNKGLKGAVNSGSFKKGQFKNEKHPFWKGGTTPFRQKLCSSIEYKNWRKAVYERDNYACRGCGARNGYGKSIRLEAHHVKSWAEHPDLRLDVNNGKTLCSDCHKTETFFPATIL